MERKRLYDIDIAVGFAIILVVIGHLASRNVTEIGLYVIVKSLIYKFHMPLFLFLSGFIAMYTYKPVNSISEYGRFIKKRFIRLMPAYFLISTVFIIGRILLGQNFDIIPSIEKILLFPSIGPSGFLWYLYVLFIYNLFLPLFLLIFKKHLYVAVIFSFMVSFFHFPEIFTMRLFFLYLPFLLLGTYFCSIHNIYYSILRKYGVWFLFIFLIWMPFEVFSVIDLPKQFVGFSAIIGIHYLSKYKIERNYFFEMVGRNSFFIYLFNSMFMGSLTLFLIMVLGVDTFYHYFYYLIPLLLFTGFYLPITFNKYVISRLPIVSKIIR